MLSVCLSICVMDVNQRDTDCNCSTQTLHDLLMNGNRTPKLGQSYLLRGSKSSAEKDSVNRHFQACSWASQPMGCLFYRGLNSQHSYLAGFRRSAVIDDQGQNNDRAFDSRVTLSRCSFPISSPLMSKRQSTAEGSFV